MTSEQTAKKTQGEITDEWAQVSDGARMRLRRAGQGEQTILLDAGWGHWSPIWAKVQEKLSEQFHTVAFDRMGLGQSDPSTPERSVFQIVDELQAALTSAQIQGPFIYVAHSFGAVYARTFAYREPQVQGMVLVDPVIEALGVSKPFIKLRSELERSFKRLLRLSNMHVLTPASYLLRLPPFARRLPKQAAREFKRGYSPQVVRTVLGELSSLEEGMKLLTGLGRPKVPVEVLSAQKDWLPGTSADAQAETRVQAMHRKFAKSVVWGQHWVVPGSGHDVHVDAPQAVVQATEGLVERMKIL